MLLCRYKVATNDPGVCEVARKNPERFYKDKRILAGFSLTREQSHYFTCHFVNIKLDEVCHTE
jgi:hypothetical protein